MSLLTRFPLMFALLVLPALARDAGHTTDSLAQIKQNVDAKKAVLVDVREPAEWDRGHLKGAIFLPLSTLQQLQNGDLDPAKRDEITRDLPKELVLYCHCAAGGRALVAAEILRGLGFEVRPLKPGFKQLVEAGFAPDPSNKD